MEAGHSTSPCLQADLKPIEIENNMELKDCVCFCLLTVLSYEVPKVEGSADIKS